MDVIAGSDRIIDIGPGAGDDGGMAVGSGPPEQLVGVPTSNWSAYNSHGHGLAGWDLAFFRMVSERHQHIALWVIGADTIAGHVVGKHCQPVLRSKYAVGRLGRETDYVPLSQSKLPDVLWIHQHDLTCSADVPQAVVIAVDRGIELVVGPQCHQTKQAWLVGKAGRG